MLLAKVRPGGGVMGAQKNVPLCGRCVQFRAFSYVFCMSLFGACADFRRFSNGFAHLLRKRFA